MIRQPHVVLAKRHGVQPATAQGWIYSGLIGRPAEPGEVKPEGRGKPPQYVVTAEDIASFTPPTMGRPTHTAESKRRTARRMLAEGRTVACIARWLGESREQIEEWTAGVERPPRPKQSESKHLKLRRLRRDSKVAIIKALRATGHSWAESARQVHVTIDAVMKWKRKGLFD